MKKMKKNNFAIFIISHGRAETMTTYNELMKRKCSSPVYIIVDNQDKQVEAYQQKYENVVVFDKEAMYDKTDTLDNFHRLTSAVYARNFCFELARKLKLKYFAMLDDDIYRFCVKFAENQKMIYKDLKNIEKAFELYLDYMDQANIDCLGFGNEGGYIGGINGKFAKGYGRTTNQAMIMRSESDIQFLGTQNEDLNIVFKNFDKLFMELYLVSITTPVRASNSGGNSTDYDTAGMYVSNFYSVIVNPSCCMLTINGSKVVLHKFENKFCPKIISGVYKK